MIPLKDFRPDIALSVGNIYEPIMDRAIVGAAIEFCDKTWSWNDWLNPLAVTPNVSEYELDYDNVNMVLISLTEVYHDGKKVNPEPVANLNKYAGDWRKLIALAPECYHLSSPNFIRVVPGFNDSATGQMTFRGAFKPHRKAKGLSDYLYNDYHDAIVNGALYRLHSQKGNSWYSPADSAEAKIEFNKAVNLAKIVTRKSRTNGSVKIRIRGAA